MARPQKLIDPEMVEKLAGAGCSAEQIGAILDCNERTIQRRFAALLKRGKERRNGRLQVELFRRAMNGSDAIAIFLAKNWLGMTDQPQVVVNVQQNAVTALGIPEERLAQYRRFVQEFEQNEAAAKQPGQLPASSEGDVTE